MSLEMCVLASGSSGNCTVLRADGEIALIDAGLGPRTTARRLNGTGVSLNEIKAIVLTHLDSDHFNLGWVNTAEDLGLRIFVHRNRLADLRVLSPRAADLSTVFTDDCFNPLATAEFTPIPLAHDDAGSHGFTIECNGSRAGYATDLGYVPSCLFEHFAMLDVLAIESNYDPRMQVMSNRPEFLKKRIMGGRGHLSNDQALSAIRRILDGCERSRRRLPLHIVLLHRSRQCNCPTLLRRLFSEDPRIGDRLVLADQFTPTPWLRVTRCAPLKGEQLRLFA